MFTVFYATPFWDVFLGLDSQLFVSNFYLISSNLPHMQIIMYTREETVQA